MHKELRSLIALMSRMCLLGFVLAATVFAQSTTFTYQGQLKNAGVNANGSYDFIFQLYDDSNGGAQLGSSLIRDAVAVNDGHFTVSLDFGNQFSGGSRFLQILVRQQPNIHTQLVPRQQVNSDPYSVKSLSAATATNSLQLDGVAAANYLQINGNGSGLTNLNGANIANNSINASALAADTFPNSRNLSLLGQRRWDLLSQRVTVGSNPRYTAFDGANVWVTLLGSSSVSKRRASDGACVGTCTFGVGSGPAGVVFDGANIWVANGGGSTVTKLRASDGACVGTCTFAVGPNPVGIAFDGANIWVTNSNGNNVTKLRASDGAVQGTFAVGSGPAGIEFDGANIWVVNQSSSNVTKLRASDGSCVAPCTFAVGLTPQGAAFDGANIWVTNYTSATVTKLRASDGACVGTCTFSVGSGASGIAFDGANIWVTNSINNNVTKLRASDGAALGTFPAGINPLGIAFDGANMWVANSSGDNTIRLPVFQ